MFFFTTNQSIFHDITKKYWVIYFQKHQIPVSAIPCLSYRRAIVEEKKLKESVENENIGTTNGAEAQKTDDESKPTSGCPYANGEKSNGNYETSTAQNPTNKDDCDEQPPPAKKSRVFGAFSNAKIETVKENLKEQSLTVQQINDYCKNLFIFKNIRVMRFT